MQHNPRITKANSFWTFVITIIDHLPFTIIYKIYLCRFQNILVRSIFIFYSSSGKLIFDTFSIRFLSRMQSFFCLLLVGTPLTSESLISNETVELSCFSKSPVYVLSLQRELNFPGLNNALTEFSFSVVCVPSLIVRPYKYSSAARY